MASPMQVELRCWAIEQALVLHVHRAPKDDVVVSTAGKFEAYVNDGVAKNDSASST